MATGAHRANGVQLTREAATTIQSGQDGVYNDSTGSPQYSRAGNVFPLAVVAFVSTTGGLTATLAGQVTTKGFAVVASTLQWFYTPDGTNWSALS